MQARPPGRLAITTAAACRMRERLAMEVLDELLAWLGEHEHNNVAIFDVRRAPCARVPL